MASPTVQSAPASGPARARRPQFNLGLDLREGYRRVIALEPVAAGAELLQVHGVFVDAPSRYSLQVAADRHVAAPEDLAPERMPDPFLWRYLNHACRPNAAFEGLRLVALRDIAAGDELTFDYNSTEYEIAEPFPCHCGGCEGRLIRGFRHLSAAEQARLAPYLASYLAALLPSAS